VLVVEVVTAPMVMLGNVGFVVVAVSVAVAEGTVIVVVSRDPQDSQSTGQFSRMKAPLLSLL
jgi:hypothetical protein